MAPSLLLLPSPPRPPSPSTLSAAYRSPLTSVLLKLRQSPTPQTLIIGLALPLLTGYSPNSKTITWSAAQSLLAGLYTLTSVICAKEDIPVDVGAGRGSVDVRIVLIDHERGRRYEPDFDGGFEANCTAVLDLAAFATKVRPWEAVYHPSCEEGYELLSSFLGLAEKKQAFTQSQLVAIEGGISLTVEPSSSPKEQQKGFNTVCLGGTFDHLHPGHKLLLHASILLLNIPPKDSDKTCTLVVGISSDELLVKKKYAEELQPWDQRSQTVLSFLSTLLEYDTTAASPPTQSSPDETIATLRDGKVKVRCIVLRDPFGPPIHEEDADAIVVSAETRSGGKAINDRRVDKGWKPLEVFEINVLDADEVNDGEVSKTEDFASKISSTAIRQQRAEAKRR
ncbi:Phosphopantetheine adenylyltransferase [Fusarium austroafricanum]|uniref:Phosphopantetheine adenylyltransferase n=1 Tax=Fusarium austroafricanum TaxID=2364996 RepID=A0A8H4PAS4_9HYPO|nr:Phosphopantetheine adenylyltransferase [Fusarium austroafricanum]